MNKLYTFLNDIWPSSAILGVNYFNQNTSTLVWTVLLALILWGFRYGFRMKERDDEYKRMKELRPDCRIKKYKIGLNETEVEFEGDNDP